MNLSLEQRKKAFAEEEGQHEVTKRRRVGNSTLQASCWRETEHGGGVGVGLRRRKNSGLASDWPMTCRWDDVKRAGEDFCFGNGRCGIGTTVEP